MLTVSPGRADQRQETDDDPEHDIVPPRDTRAVPEHPRRDDQPDAGNHIESAESRDVAAPPARLGRRRGCGWRVPTGPPARPQEVRPATTARSGPHLVSKAVTEPAQTPVAGGPRPCSRIAVCHCGSFRLRAPRALDARDVCFAQAAARLTGGLSSTVRAVTGKRSRGPQMVRAMTETRGRGHTDSERNCAR